MYDYAIVLKILNLYDVGQSDRYIEKLTGVSKSTCNLWKNKYYNNYKNLLERYIKNHKNSEKEFIDSIDDTVFNYIQQLVEKSPFINYKTFISLINNKFGIKLNNIKMKFLLKNLNLTKKCIRQRVIKSADFLKQIIENRKKFKEIIKMEIINNIISIDETGFNRLLNKNTEGYSLKGTEINIPIPELNLKNTSLIMAVSTSGIINHDILLDNVNSEIYFNFIDSTIKQLKMLNPTNIYVFIFDNVAFHKNIKILDLIKDNNYKYYFIPPYSPNLNPIENIFGILKNEINKDIINSFMNDKLYDNYKNINKKCNKDRQLHNKIIRDTEKEIVKNNIKNYKITNNNFYKDKNEKECIIIKKNNIDIDKQLIQDKIKNIKIINKNEKQQQLIKFIKNEKITMNQQINEKKEHKYNIFKKFIINNIEKFNKNYNETKIKKIFDHAFTFEHINIENEIRDRFNIK